MHALSPSTREAEAEAEAGASPSIPAGYHLPVSYIINQQEELPRTHSTHCIRNTCYLSFSSSSKYPVLSLLPFTNVLLGNDPMGTGLHSPERLDTDPSRLP